MRVQHHILGAAASIIRCYVGNMQHSPSSQLKINQFLRPVPALQPVDDDCYIVAEGYKKLSNCPTESAVIHAGATPRIHPRINDDDDDDELLVQPQDSNVNDHTLQQRDGRGGTQRRA